ncbi:tetratricopeptide repeat protein [Asanoa hainanensis]|nr:tetratricopeptide repeat protein [Asanoa hainanensis]
MRNIDVPTPSQARSQRVWNVPTQGRHFSNRTSELAAIGDLMMRGVGRALLLHGMAGVGKTETAIAFALRKRSELEIGWWIDSATRVTVIAALARLAEQLGIPSANDLEAAQAVVNRLGEAERWLLIFDNAEEPADLDGLVPMATTGTVLITSRNPRFERLAEQMMVEPFDHEHAARFLTNRSGDRDVATARVLAGELGGLPLALEQAGAYCSDAGVDLDGYLDRYSSRKVALLQEGAATQHVSVDTTLRISVARARRLNHAAADLLQLMAFLAPADVPRDLLVGAPTADLPTPLAQASGDILVLDRAVAVLRQTSLLTAATPVSLRVHQLVADLLRSHLERRSSRISRMVPTLRWPGQRWLRCALRVLGHYGAPDGRDPKSWARAAVLQPHVLTVLGHVERLRVALGQADTGVAAGLLGDIAINVSRGGAVSDAVPLAERALALARALDEGSPERVRVTNKVAQVLHGAGRPAEAESLYVPMLELLERTRGWDDALTAEIANNLAGVYMEQEDHLEQSLSLMDAALTTWTRVLGTSDLRTLIAMQNKARNLRRLGRNDEALTLAREAYNLQVALNGEDHLDALVCLNNLAESTRVAGDLVESERLHARALAARERLLGPASPPTMISRNNLARVRALRGDLFAAGAMYRQVLADAEGRLPADHPCVTNAKNGIAQFSSGANTA